MTLRYTTKFPHVQLNPQCSLVPTVSLCPPSPGLSILRIFTSSYPLSATISYPYPDIQRTLPEVGSSRLCLPDTSQTDPVPGKRIFSDLHKALHKSGCVLIPEQLGCVWKPLLCRWGTSHGIACCGCIFDFLSCFCIWCLFGSVLWTLSHWRNGEHVKINGYSLRWEEMTRWIRCYLANLFFLT